ncbi:choline-sulfatase [Photobacterium damselae subsp. damselae]|nr:choline-sulfatase [Photobacterium damselae subsp. damselae]
MLMTFKQKLHSHGWFILINSLLLIAISSRYFLFLPEFPTNPLELTFLVVGTLSQMVLLATLIGAIAIPALWLPKNGRHIVLALIASIGVAALFIDTFVFAQYRFHINAVVLELVLSGQVVSFPFITWLMVIGGIVLLFAAELFTVKWLERKVSSFKGNYGYKFTLLTVLCLLLTNGIHIWAAAYAYQPVTTIKRYLPLFYPATANSFMRKQGWIDEEAIERQKSLKMNTKSDLNYPLSPLTTVPVTKPVNIMILAVDSWRADTFNADNTPKMWQFAQSGVTFNNHISTGNATRTGIFGLFYGLPGTYWQSFLANQRSPVFIDRLQALGYQLGIFTAAQLRSPEFNQTVFANIKDLRIGSKGNSPSELDADLTKDWLAWYAHRDKSKPTFSFLFYDSPHGYDFPKDFEPRYEPMLKEVNYLDLNNDFDPTPFFNRYKTSVRYVDTLANKVLTELKKSGDLANTVVIITGDHGQEMNDNKLNFWGHNGNFTNAQVKVPFAIFGPGINADSMKWNTNTLTSHQDVVPTLMKHYLGVTSPIRNYSVGDDLLGNEIKRDWVISSKYSGYAIITDHSILEVGAGGQYDLMDKTNRPLKDQTPNFEFLKQAFEQISRFNK